MTAQQHQSDTETEISLMDIVQFGIDSWKRLVVAAFIGATLGLGIWFFLGQYSAEYTLLNNTNNTNNTQHT